VKQRIIFFGSGEYTIPIIEVLREYDLRLVVTTETEGPFIKYLKENKIPFLSSHVKDQKDLDQLKKEEPTIGVLASYGAILPQSILDLFPEGIINVHPSLLPKYKGPSPIQSTILAGETETGTTIIKLDDQVDHGPILMQDKVSLIGDETTQGLKNALFTIGSYMIGSILEKLESSNGGLTSRGETSIRLSPQDHSQETFTEKITKQDGYIDFENPPSPDELDRKIRAFYPWPTVWFKTKINGREKLIKLFPEKQIQVEGKRIMSYKDFINGYPEGKEILKQLSLQ
jgi:methionyl-tRNA formyltransferase